MQKNVRCKVDCHSAFNIIDAINGPDMKVKVRGDDAKCFSLAAGDDGKQHMLVIKSDGTWDFFTEIEV